jgi:hypothetical protein
MYELQNRIEPTIKNGFGSSWLGCLVEALGSSWEKVHCRGEWSCLEMNDNIITFCTETAWSPCTEVFDLIKSQFPSIEIFYLSTEPGCELFETNDAEGRFFPERYIVDLCTTDGEYRTEYFEELEDALKWIEKMTDRKVSSEEEVEVLDSQLASENEDAFCYLHKIDII